MSETSQDRQARLMFKRVTKSLVESLPDEDRVIGLIALELGDDHGAWHSIVVGFAGRIGRDRSPLMYQEPKLT